MVRYRFSDSTIPSRAWTLLRKGMVRYRFSDSTIPSRAWTLLTAAVKQGKKW